MKLKIKYFSDVPNYGDLYVDKVLFEYEDYSYFILTNNYHYFISHCYEVEKQQSWVINRIDINTLVNFLSNKMDIRSVFLNNNENKIIATKNYMNEKESFKEITGDELKEMNILPDENVFMDLQKDDYKDYINSLIKGKIINGVCDAKEVANPNLNWEITPITRECVQIIFLNTTYLNIIEYLKKNYPAEEMGYLTFCVNENLFNMFLLNRHGTFKNKKSNIIKFSPYFFVKKYDNNSDILEDVCYISDSDCNIVQFKKHFLDTIYADRDKIYFKIEK